MLYRLDLIGKDALGYDEEALVVIEKGKFKLRVKTDRGWVIDHSDFDYKGPKLRLTINHRLLAEAFSLLHSMIIGEKSLKLIGENFEHVVMLISKE